MHVTISDLLINAVTLKYALLVPASQNQHTPGTAER
jgi:hypothetical protein